MIDREDLAAAQVRYPVYRIELPVKAVRELIFQALADQGIDAPGVRDRTIHVFHDATEFNAEEMNLYTSDVEIQPTCSGSIAFVIDMDPEQ